MRIGTGDEFLRTTGGTLTGALTISANVSPPLTVNRPDGVASDMIHVRLAGAGGYALEAAAAQPRCIISDPGVAPRFTMNTDTGLLGSSLIPLSMLRVDEQTAENAGVVTILAAATTIASLASMTVAVGDRIMYSADALIVNGATAGTKGLWVAQTAGTAAIVAEFNAPTAGVQDDILAGATHSQRVSGILAVTVAGTLTLSLRASSAGSDSTVSGGDGEIRALVLRG